MTTLKLIVGVAFVTSYCLVNYRRDDTSPFTTGTYYGTFAYSFLVELLIWVFYVVVLYSRFFSPLRHIPGPKGGSWWNGQMPLLSKEMDGTSASHWMRTIPHQHMIRYLGLFNAERLVLSSKEAIAEVLSRNYDFPKPSIVEKLAGPVLGIGLVISEGDAHKQQRKLVTPAFGVKNIKALFPVFWGKSIALVSRMAEMMAEDLTVAASKEAIDLADLEDNKEDISHAVFEIGEWASRAALDIITTAALGKDFKAIEDPDTELNVTYRTVFVPSRIHTILAVLKHVFSPFIHKRLPIPGNGVMEKAAKVIRGVCRDVILEKQDLLAKGNLTDPSLVSLIVKAQNIDNEGVIDQMTTMLAAGHETAAISVTWAIYMMCIHPEWQKHLRNEVRSTLPSPALAPNSTITSNDIEKMISLNIFCREILRYWPPISMTARIATRDTEVMGQKVPKGTRLVFTMISTNRDERLRGDDASIFRPERRLENDGKINQEGGCPTKYGLLTFLHGQRMCLGHGFARDEMACMVAALVGGFEFDSKNEEEYDEKNLKISGGGISARLINGLWVGEVQGCRWLVITENIKHHCM